VKPYRLLIQKQPGKGVIPHTIVVNGQEERLEVNTDTEVEL